MTAELFSPQSPAPEEEFFTAFPRQRLRYCVFGIEDGMLRGSAVRCAAVATEKKSAMLRGFVAGS